MNLHTNKKVFADTLRFAAKQLNIPIEFVEKDYWITLVLNRLAKSKYSSETVFKGGTSLSKGFGLIQRFSEDVDIAIIDENNKSGNAIKTIIRTVEKEMTKELKELNVPEVTSKGSRFRKSLFEYESIDKNNHGNKLIVEVNSFANHFPYQKLTIKSLLFDFLIQTNNKKIIEQYDLQSFQLNVLNKEQTLMEKLVSLIRFSFELNPTESISRKVRHFYDLYFLMNDEECSTFVNSKKFRKQFNEILNHDKELFDEPKGWQKKSLIESPLINDFEIIWDKVKGIYQKELSVLTFTEMPNEREVAKSFCQLIKKIE